MIKDTKNKLKPVNFEDYKKILENNFKTKKYDGIILSGAEVTVKNDLIDFVKYANSFSNIKSIRIQTNGRKLSDINYCKNLIDSGVDDFFISLNGPNSEIHDGISSIKGSFDETISGIKNLSKFDVNIITNTVISRLNYEHLLSIFELTLQFDHITETYFWNYWPMSKTDPDNLLVSNDVLKDYLIRLIKYADKSNKKRLIIKNFPECLLADYSLFLDNSQSDIIVDKSLWDGYKDNKFDQCIFKNECDSTKCSGLTTAYINKHGWDENLLSPIKQDRKMKRVDIKTGFLCNNNCLFCVQADNKCKGNRSIEDIKNNLDECKDRCQEVVLTGGEVTIRKDFLEIIKYARGIGYPGVQIQSNGRMFSSLGFCKKVIDAGATSFALALHGYSEEQHDGLTKAQGSFKQTVEGIRNLKSLGAYVLLNTVVVKQNYKDLEKIAKLLVSLDVDQFQLAFVHAMGNAWLNYDEVVPRMSDAAPYIHKGLQIGIEAGKSVMAEAMPYCMMKGYEDYVAEKFIPDSEIRGLNFQNTDDFSFLRKNHGKVKFPQCKECKFDSVCEGPWNDYPKKMGEEEFKAVK